MALRFHTSIQHTCGGKTRGKRAVEARECLQSQRTAVSDAAAAREVCLGCWTRMRNAGRDRCGRFQPMGRPRPVRQFRAPSLPFLLFCTLRELSHVTIINIRVTKYNKSSPNKKRKAREIALSYASRRNPLQSRTAFERGLSAHSLLPHCSDRRSHAQTHHCLPLGTWQCRSHAGGQANGLTASCEPSANELQTRAMPRDSSR